MNESSGTLTKMIEDPALYNRLLTTSASLEESSTRFNSVLEKIDKGDGVAGTIVNDKQLAVELKDTVTELRLLVKDIKSDPKKYFKFSVF